ncbi:MAG: alpha/beta fold hydrolase [Betaproteobacteria bacterium]|nr:MAG: alpha/beta fold hydrolase [Betaproteobacteria bacterium]
MTSIHTFTNRSMLSLRATTFLSVCLLVVLLSACSSTTGDAKASAAKVSLADCRIKGFDTIARCAMLAVPEDHQKPASTQLDIFVAVLPALAQRPEPDPLFIFAGGPGQAASDLGRLASTMNDIRKSRDIVLVDQRGTGKSKTVTCEGTSNEGKDPVAEVLSNDVTSAEKAWTKCMATLKGNPATHRTDDYIDDLELVRKALGYRSINVWGGSYGSRVALRYMKRFPSSIRSAVLDGVAPTALRLPDDAMLNSESELKNALSACAASTSCAKAYPNLSGSLDALLERLRGAPQAVSFAHPSSGATVNGLMTDRSVISLLWPLLYAPDSARLIPSLIGSALAGNFAPMMSTLTTGGVAEADIAIVQRFAIMCAEDMLGRSPPTLPRFKALSDMFYGFCKALPHGKVAPEFFEPTVSDIPTLLLSGSLDPVTPPTQGELAAKTLKQSKHVTFNGLGHIVSPHSCARRLMAKFVAAGNIAAAVDSCEGEINLPRPHFYVSALEARP